MISSYFLTHYLPSFLPTICLEGTQRDLKIERGRSWVRAACSQPLLTGLLGRESDTSVLLLFSKTDLCIRYFLPPSSEGKHWVPFSMAHLPPVKAERYFCDSQV